MPYGSLILFYFIYLYSKSSLRTLYVRILTNRRF